jgi:glycosyltransferase involved in cell wall biosynthesis
VSTNHTLYTEYVHYVPVRPKALTRGFVVALMKWYYSGCDAVVAPSAAAGQVLRSYGIGARIEVIKTGVVAIAPLDHDQRIAARLRHGVGEDGFLLLYVGRIAREKNLTMLLKAFKTVAARSPEARLVLVGGGPALNETKALAAELGLRQRVEFVGMLPREKIDPIYAAADAFVFPSTTETQGIAICEALSAGLPVVAVNAGGIPENIRSGVDGFLTSNDADEFADRISTLVTNVDERRAMGEQARAGAANFSIERMVGDFERFYESVIESRSGAPSVAAAGPG